MVHLSTPPMHTMFSNYFKHNIPLIHQVNKKLYDTIIHRVRFIFRHPKSIDAVNVFLLPFQNMVWYAMIGLCLVSAFIVRVTCSLEKELAKKSKMRTVLQHSDSSYSNSLLMVFGFVFQQSMSFFDWTTYIKHKRT